MLDTGNLQFEEGSEVLNNLGDMAKIVTGIRDLGLAMGKDLPHALREINIVVNVEEGVFHLLNSFGQPMSYSSIEKITGKLELKSSHRYAVVRNENAHHEFWVKMDLDKSLLENVSISLDTNTPRMTLIQYCRTKDEAEALLLKRASVTTMEV